MGYADESIHRYYNLLASDPTRAKLTVFTKVFQAKEEETLTFREMRNDAAAFIIAGSDTTANTLTYAVWSICRHPQVKARLMEELRNLPDDYTDEHLRTLPYLSQVIEETLRVYSVVGTGLPREVPASGASLCGYWLPPRSTVCAQSYSMHQDPVAFPDPGEFRPERWEKPTKEMKDAMMAFGLGSRGTISQASLPLSIFY
jgi:cytochrome P450